MLGGAIPKRLLSLDVVDEQGPRWDRAERILRQSGRQGPLDGVSERLRGDRLVGRRGEPVPGANRERVRAPVRRDLRHGGGDLRPELEPLWWRPVRVVQQLRARGVLDLVCRLLLEEEQLVTTPKLASMGEE